MLGRSLVLSAAENPKLQWPVVASYLFNAQAMAGLWMTVLVTVLVMIIATLIGTIVAVMMRSPSHLIAAPARGFVWLFRGVPALVQLIIWYNLSIFVPEISLSVPVLGTLFSLPTNNIMTPMLAAVAALSLSEAAYMAEIVRAGLGSVGKGQVEAAASLGMKPLQILRRITLPQAMRLIIPPTGNETINLLKTTSLISIIAVGDLLYSVQAIYARTFETIPLLLVATFWYLMVVSVMTVAQSFVERRFSEGSDESRK